MVVAGVRRAHVGKALYGCSERAQCFVDSDARRGGSVRRGSCMGIRADAFKPASESGVRAGHGRSALLGGSCHDRNLHVRHFRQCRHDAQFSGDGRDRGLSLFVGPNGDGHRARMAASPLYDGALRTCRRP